MENKKFSRILVVRTDRIGDVLLSTPVLKALKRNFPRSYIAVMVRPYARDIVLGNPYLDEVIIYDKYGAQRSVCKTIKFSQVLKSRRFDLALILHPTNRAHLIAFLAGIKKRVGFNRKMGFLLSDKIEHKKQEGQKHELEYTLDIIRSLGVAAQDRDLFMPIRKDSEDYIEQFLSRKGVHPDEKIVAIHPAASCPSKVWPLERFAAACDQLIEEFNVKIVVVSGPGDIDIGENIIQRMRSPAIDACGQTTLSQLASLLRRCSLFISNDSGPVHLAQALGTAVVAIFGRSQPGLSYRRWGPTGKGIVLHKDVGCRQCLAHNCQKDFACLKAIAVPEVLAASREFLVDNSVLKR